MANSDLSTSTTVKDVKQLGIWAALASLSYVFWVCGAMEMVERLAYYGVRQVSSLYATDAASNGGLGLKGSDVGIIFLFWALMQSFVPVFTGGISDRVGYKETIFASTVIKILGYLLMAWFPTFWGFMAGALMLAFGTGIFKPGIQATIVKSTSRENSSMAWGVFYQTVNIGGFIGPLLAAQLRQLEWSHVFYACAGIISINFLSEVGRDPGNQPLARQSQGTATSNHDLVHGPVFRVLVHADGVLGCGSAVLPGLGRHFRHGSTFVRRGRHVQSSLDIPAGHDAGRAANSA
jgi:MFS family permease